MVSQSSDSDALEKEQKIIANLCYNLYRKDKMTKMYHTQASFVQSTGSL